MTTLSCPAKVNIFLAIKGRDDSGYHELETIMVRTKKIEDLIYIEPAEEFSFECDSLPAQGNTVLKAMDVLQEETGKSFKYKIRLEKKIPLQSGLGGGSSDAAAVMLFLNEKEGLGIEHSRLIELGAKVGMDVPFFLSGYQVARCTHYGEKLEELPDLPKDLEFEIHQSGVQISTEEAYVMWDERGKQSNAKSTDMIEAIEKQDAAGIVAALHNDFQTIFQFVSPQSLNDSNGLLLTGSGGAFCVFDVSGS